MAILPTENHGVPPTSLMSLWPVKMVPKNQKYYLRWWTQFLCYFNLFATFYRKECFGFTTVMWGRKAAGNSDPRQEFDSFIGSGEGGGGHGKLEYCPQRVIVLMKYVHLYLKLGNLLILLKKVHFGPF